MKKSELRKLIRESLEGSIRVDEGLKSFGAKMGIGKLSPEDIAKKKLEFLEKLKKAKAEVNKLVSSGLKFHLYQTSTEGSSSGSNVENSWVDDTYSGPAMDDYFGNLEVLAGGRDDKRIAELYTDTKRHGGGYAYEGKVIISYLPNMKYARIKKK